MITRKKRFQGLVTAMVLIVPLLAVTTASADKRSQTTVQITAAATNTKQIQHTKIDTKNLSEVKAWCTMMVEKKDKIESDAIGDRHNKAMYKELTKGAKMALEVSRRDNQLGGTCALLNSAGSYFLKYTQNNQIKYLEQAIQYYDWAAESLAAC